MPKDEATRTTMNSVDRALSLLRFFTVEAPEHGLSALARAARYDKTTTLRCLTALERNGLVEQHPETRKYRIGIAPLQLARTREHSFPMQALLQPVLDRLAADLGETAHASVVSHRALVTVAIAEPSRATRVHVDPSELLPFHATASGLAVLAHMAPDTRAGLGLSDDLHRFTAETPCHWSDLDAQLDAIRRSGLGRAVGTFEDDVVGTAVPIFGWSDKVIGAVAVASVASRHDTALASRIDAALREAGTEISRQIRG